MWQRLHFNGWRCVRAYVSGLSIYSRHKDCVVYLRAVNCSTDGHVATTVFLMFLERFLLNII